MSDLHGRSGYIALVGHPNVGKSSLLNALLGQQIAPVTPRPQTTRRNQLGILTRPDAQLVFLDTPGIHKPINKLGAFMNEAAEMAIREADIIAVIADISQEPGPEDLVVAERMTALAGKKTKILIGNKADLIQENHQADRQAPFIKIYQCDSHIIVSALTGSNLNELADRLISLLPQGEFYFEPDQLTDLYERDISGELIRAACLHRLREEVPYSIAVRVDNFKERANGMVFIETTLFVEKESQKGIVIGRGGSMLKTIGMDARLSIEEMLGVKVFLELRVKVEKNWRNNPEALKRFGYKLE
ncbi:MAG: GTPase Era [Anaerolineaceae bacterium]|nr:GTPase Era [Anaerolineaceae bacterium]MBN2678296.1 GTPase Era [Anaerolineaceae bacterium]